MDSTRRYELKVGIMVGLGMLVFIITNFMLGGDNVFRSNYTLKVNLSQVQGLGPGSVVQLLGIPVGNVRAINISRISGHNQLEVELKIDKSFQKQITLGSTAGIRTQGALGDKYVYITPGPLDQKPLEDGDILIAEHGEGLIDTLISGGDKLERIYKIIDEIYTLFKNINENGRSAVLMDNLAQSSLHLNQLTAEGTKLLKAVNGPDPKENKMKQTFEHLEHILGKIDAGQGTLGALVNDRALYENLKRLTGGGQEKNLKNVIRSTIQGSGQ